MANVPPTDPRLLEMLDCCRPNTADRNDPLFGDLAAEMRQNAALASAAQRIEAVDVKLVAAFQDVAVPDGLGDRILARLASHQTHLNGSDTPSLTVSLPDLGGAAVVLPRRSRRFWLAGAISAVAAACLVAAIVPALRQHSWQPSEIVDQTVALFTSEKVTEGRADVSPAEYPFSRDVLHLRGTKWRRVEGLLRCGGVAYDLPAMEGSRATLYVLHAHGKDLPTSAPARPLFDTGDCSVAAWQDGELLYVLAVHGGARAYQNYLDLRGGPLAMLYLPGLGLPHSV